MALLSVIVAGVAAYAFGAVWYMALSRAWIDAAGLRTGPDGRPEGSTPLPFVISAIMILIVAGMMRHIFAMSNLDTVTDGVMGGFGIGAFLVVPWIVTNYAYSMRPRALSFIDGGYALIGCTIIGTVLALF